MKQSRGFTLIELVVVILILGILSATALPRFLNVNTQAHHAAVAGATGGLAAGVALARGGWLAQGSTAAATVTNFGANNIHTNAAGWPVGITGGATTPDAFDADTDCVELWNNLMQNPPTVATATGSDYLATFTASKCRYTYQADTNRYIEYDASNGSVVATNS